MSSEEFLELVNSVHGGKYGYERCVYKNQKGTILVTCPRHGDFSVGAGFHLKGQGCLLCKQEDNFLARARKAHGDRYTYPDPYVSWNEKIRITCSEHGDFFQNPAAHGMGQGCPMCSGRPSYTPDSWISAAKKKHPEYIYEKTAYTLSTERVVVTCPKHGDFSVVAGEHIRGSGCPACAGRRPFEEKAREVHGDRYDYSKVDYKGSHTNVTIICREHGVFEQLPANHLRGSGCPNCSAYAPKDREWFLQEARRIHGNTYGYDHFVYTTMLGDALITCPTHGDVVTTGVSHIYHGRGCPLCTNVSSPHQKVLNLLDELGVDYRVNVSGILSGRKELDVVTGNIAIEVDGLYWHTLRHKESKTYHQDKQEECKKAGLTLIQFWDFEINEKWDIVRSMISHALGKTAQTVYARSCEIRALSSRDYREFLTCSHLQGAVNSKLRLGLTYDGRLVSAIGASIRNGTWVLDRFTSLPEYSVVGGFSRLLKQLPRPLTTHSANRYASGDLYHKAGFVVESEFPYTLYYTDGTALFSRNRFQKHLLKEMKGFSNDKTADEILAENHIYPIYAAGTKTWKLPS